MRFNILVVLCCLSFNALAAGEKTPIEIEATSLAYDQNKNMAVAAGEVKVVQGKEIVLADEVIYLKDEEKLYAKGHIAARREDGAVYFADVVNFEKKLDKGRMLAFKTRLGKKGLLASHGAEMKDSKHTNLYSMVFSSCKVCKSNLRPNVPLWQVRASEAKIDLKAERIIYKNARIEAHGVPIMYTPYFSTPTPGAKRKTGFLAPGVIRSSLEGSAISLPFYLNIAPNKDLTYTARVNVGKIFAGKGRAADGNGKLSNATMHSIEFRHLLNSGSYIIAGSLLEGRRVDKNGLSRTGKYSYGHVNSNGDFHQNDGIFTGDYGFQLQGVRDSSRTYTKRYKLMEQDVLTSKIYHQKQGRDYFVESQAIVFQDLRNDHSVQSTANALPYVQAQYQGEITSLGVRVGSRLNALSLKRLQGYNYQRASWENEIQKKLYLPYGQIMNVEAKVRGDAYKVGYNKIIKNDLGNKTTGKPGEYGRLHTQLKFEWLYPLINKIKSTVVILEPVMQFILSPKVENNFKIPNEDSQDFEISAANLFNDNRYLGIDRVETGNRLNYGVRGVLEHSSFNRISFLVGQNYHMTNNYYAAASGLQNKFSDYVTQITYEPITGMKIVQRSRFDKDNGALNRNEIGLSYGRKDWSLTIDYSGASRKVVNYMNIYRHEIGATVAYNIYDAWWVTLGSRRKLGVKPDDQSNGMIYNTLDLNYRGECFNINLGVKRDYTKLRGVMPTTRYTLNVLIPTM